MSKMEHQLVLLNVQDLMAWTKDQHFIEDYLKNSVSNKAKEHYQKYCQLIISGYASELMPAIVELKDLFM